MRRLLLAPVCFLVACAGSVPALRPVAPAGPVASERQGWAEAAAHEAVASALVATVEAARVASRAAPGVRPTQRGFAGTPSGDAALIVQRAVQLVGLKQLERGVPDDCSGLGRLTYQKAGIDLVNHGFLAGENAVTAILPPRRGPGRRPPAPPAPGGPRLLPRDV